MSFGKKLQFLRGMRDQMTQEKLAEQLNVSRQTVSKWELDQAYPEMKKALEICDVRFAAGTSEICDDHHLPAFPRPVPVDSQCLSNADTVC